MKFKITIPEICHENWDKMTPTENGRFCLSCSKTVMDFISMLPDEIQHYFIQNQNNKICGRFRKTQLDNIIIQIPSRILYSQNHYNKIFLLTLFLTTGTILFSCNDKEGNKKQNDEIEVADGLKKNKNGNSKQIPPSQHPSKDELDHSEENIPITEKVSLEEKTSDKNDSDHHITTAAKTDQIKSIITEESSKSKTQIKKNNTPKKETGVKADTGNKNAELPGGIDQFYTFFENEFKMPESANTSKLKITIAFTVEKNGSVSYLNSEPPVDKIIEKEIIRVLSLCPKWQPGESNGKKTKMQYSLPIVLQ